MKTKKTFLTAQELKIACKTKLGNGQSSYDSSQIKSMNGYEFMPLSPDITNKHVSAYDADMQDNKLFNAPYIVEFKG